MQSMPAKAHAKAQVKELMNFRKFVEHIADHGGHQRGQVKGVLSDMCACLVEQLLEGKKILLDDLGDFWITLNSVGAESCEAFSSKNITSVNIIFTPGKDFENLINRAEFNPVASRIAQRASYMAEKRGETVVDLTAAKNKDNGADDSSDPSGSGETPSGGSDTPTGGNDNQGTGTDTPSVDEP